MQWYSKAFSQLTHVAVSTLHHYDEIGLLKPSIRLDNGYRVYSQADLVRLQQIKALKFFGFELSQIQKIMEGNVNTLAHFKAQRSCLKAQQLQIQEAISVLDTLIFDTEQHQSLDWQQLIQLMEAYTMQNNAKQQWASLLAPELREEFLAWEATFTKEEYQEYQQDSEAFNDKIRQHLKDDPAGQEGLAIAKQCMDQINQHYGQKHGKIRTAFWKAYREGQIPESMVHKELAAWLVKAVDAYFAKRAKDVLSEIKNNLAVDPKSPQGQKLVQLWYDLVNEMWGGDEEMKAQVWDTVALEPMPEVHAWLKNAGAKV